MKDEFLGDHQKAEQMFGPNIDISASLTDIDVSMFQINCCKPGPGSTLWCQILAAWSIVLLEMIRLRDDTCSMLPASHQTVTSGECLWSVLMSTWSIGSHQMESFNSHNIFILDTDQSLQAAFLRSQHLPVVHVTNETMWPVVRGHRMSHVGQDHSRPIWTFHHSFSIKSASQRCLHARLIPQNSSHVTWKVIFSWNIYFKFNDRACGEEMLSVMMIWYKLIINSCLINNITQTPPSKDPPSTQNTQYFSLNFSFGCYQRQDVKKYWRCWNVLQI